MKPWSPDNCGVAGTLGSGALVSNVGSSICSRSVKDISDLPSLKIDGAFTDEPEAEIGIPRVSPEDEMVSVEVLG